MDEPSDLPCHDSGLIEAPAPMFKGDATVSLVGSILADPVHSAYIEAGYWRAGVRANGKSALSELISVNGDAAEAPILKVESVGFSRDRSIPAVLVWVCMKTKVRPLKECCEELTEYGKDVTA